MHFILIIAGELHCWERRVTGMNQFYFRLAFGYEFEVFIIPS